MKRMRSGLCGMIAGAAWAAAILGAMYIGYSWIAPLCGSIAGVMTCAMVYYGEEKTEGKHEFLGHCASCRFWMTTLSPEDRAEAARYENTDGVCDMFNEDGFSPNDHCSRWEAWNRRATDERTD